MLQDKFYWGTARKAITAFGSLFTEIYVDRRNENTGKVEQTIKVPLSYSPRQKSIATIEATPESYEQEFQVILPRMGFEITGFQYDETRQISATQYTNVGTNGRMGSKLSAPVPYNIDIKLSVYTRNQDDGWQVMEQILPFFNPDYCVNKNSIPDLNLEEDIPIILTNVNFTDLYDGAYTERRMIIWELDFHLKLNFFGPVRKQGVIKRTIVDINNLDTGAGIEQYTATVNPMSANKEDVHTIDEIWKETY